MGAASSDIPTNDVRTDEFLRTFKPSRITPMPTTWPRDQPQWNDYDFLSVNELVRWSELRYEMFVGKHPTRKPGNAKE